jgi:hypothetical protein
MKIGILFLALFFSIVFIFAQMSPDSLMINQYSSAPVIDAVCDAVYGDAGKEIAIAIQDSTDNPELLEEPADLSGYFKAGWFGDSLYIIIDVMDDILDTDDQGATYNNDGVEIYFDGDNSKLVSSADMDNDILIRIEADQEHWPLPPMCVVGPCELFDTTLARFKTLVKDTEDGYSIEFAFSIEGLGIVGDDRGWFGFDVQVNDADNDPPGAGDRETILRWHSESDNTWHWAHL